MFGDLLTAVVRRTGLGVLGGYVVSLSSGGEGTALASEAQNGDDDAVTINDISWDIGFDAVGHSMTRA